jgi:hypothetical protein
MLGLSSHRGIVAKGVALRQLICVVVVVVAGSGCAHYRDVSVLVVSAKTRQPLAGIEVATTYVPKPFSLASRRQDKQPTGEDGIAFLRANHLEREPTLLGLSRDEFSPLFCTVHEGILSLATADVAGALGRSEADLRKDPVVTFEVAEAPKRRADQPVPLSEIRAQPSWIAQLGTDLRAVWWSLSRLFQEEVACSGGLEK